jgi:hypothetical protein
MGEITHKQLKEIAPIAVETIRKILDKFVINPEVGTRSKEVLTEEAFAKLATHDIINRIIKNNERRSDTKPIGGGGGS